MTFVNLETGARTYIASLKVDPNFAPALEAGTRADRKAIAYGAMVDAEVAVKTTLVPKLDALRAEGLVRDYDFATGTYSVIGLAGSSDGMRYIDPLPELQWSSESLAGSGIR